MAKTATLKTAARASTGSADARRTRAEGHVPVNIYGHGEQNQNLAIGEHELELALNTATQVFTLSIGGKDQPCLVKHVQWDTFGTRILHVDFARVSLTEEVEVEVTLVFTGHAKGLAEGGVMAVHHPALWVRCLASAIPDSIEVDVSDIGMGHALHASDIKLPPGVALDLQKVHATDQIVGVVAPRMEVPEPTAEVAVAGAEGAAPAAEGDAAAGATPAEGGKPAAGGKPGAPAAGGKPGAPAAGGKPGAPAGGGKPGGGAPGGGKDKGGKKG